MNLVIFDFCEYFSIDLKVSESCVTFNESWTTFMESFDIRNESLRSFCSWAALSLQMLSANITIKIILGYIVFAFHFLSGC
jgi:hypothetical protein